MKKIFILLVIANIATHISSLHGIQIKTATKLLKSIQEYLEKPLKPDWKLKKKYFLGLATGAAIMPTGYKYYALPAYRSLIGP